MDSNEALIRQYLTSDNSYVKALTCLKGCVRLYLEATSPAERLHGKSYATDSRGFNKFDVRRMSRLAKMLLNYSMPCVDDITWCTYAMPKYAKQLSKLSNVRNVQADKVELWLSNELPKLNKFRYSKV